jgi:O-antigen ligase
MRNILNLYIKYRPHLAFIGFLGIIAGLLFSRTALSVSMIYLAGLALLNPQLKRDFYSFCRNFSLLGFTSLFLLYLLYGLHISDPEFYFSRLRIKLPFLILPFTFWGLPHFTKKQLNGLLLAFVCVVSCITLWELGHYLTHWQQLAEAYRKAEVLSTPMRHVRFSLMVAFAAVAALYLGWKKQYVFYHFEVGLNFALGSFLFLFLHLLAVRSGLLAFYSVLLVALLILILRYKKYWTGIGALLFLGALPIAGYYIIPTFQSKIDYTIYDLKKYSQGKDPDKYSDARRIISYKIGWKIARQNPFFGVGIDQLQESVKKEYKENYPQVDREIMPHNQFLYYFAATGLVGLLWFTSVLLSPFFIQKNYRHELFLAFNIIVFSSLFVEATFETQIGTAFYLSFLLLFLNHLNK